MAFGNSPAGTITKQATGVVSTRRLGVADSANISKGDVVFVNSTGFVDVAGTAADEGGFYVAIEPANNSSGSDGDISVPLAVGGHYVTVVADGPINPGDRVKISDTSAGEVVAAVTTDAESLIVGTYWGLEGGIISKDASTPFEETFTDDADFVPVAATDADIIEVELKK